LEEVEVEGGVDEDDNEHGDDEKYINGGCII
jgi:hypothetical protein